MFSGLISYSGRIAEMQRDERGGMRLVVVCEGIEREHPEVKDSIAVDGVCLTATEILGDRIAFDVIPETIERSTLGARTPGDRVNLEYSLRVGDRMGGHFVYAHVDARARVIARTPEGQGERMRIERPARIADGIVEKGYVAVDGVSLTVAATGPDWFELALIPETIGRTTLGARPVGSDVNLEIDPLARYVAAALGARG
ncbi:MAG: riboflavin synthase [Candidatus Eremiobacteraeota bacterium]|nr:riboflavin synthase [Candidatus Eremiobacteraeota bacterium]